MPQSLAEELKSISMSSNLGQSLDRAHRAARDQSHRLVLLEHLLLALTDDSEAAIILESANVDLLRLRADVSGYLGRLMEDMRADGPVEPRPDPELLRVLQAAASAAQQSRRRQIDGAIVLAAIVGDGKSPAAGLLKTLGMTFEGAIRALQRANAQARFGTNNAAGAASPSASAKAPVQPVHEAHLGAAAEMPNGDGGDPAQMVLPSSEEFLAAARSRILQRRHTSAKPEAARIDTPAPHAPAAAVPVPEPVQPAAPPLPPAAASSAPELAAALPVRSAEPPAAFSQAEQETVAGLAVRLEAAAAHPSVKTSNPMPAETRAPPVGPLPSPPLANRPLAQVPARPLQPGEGPLRPPLPPRGVPPSVPPHPPWPEAPAHRSGQAPAANGSLGAPHARALDGVGPTGARPRPTKKGRAGEHAGKGPFTESIPRRMQIGKIAPAEVRIARDRVEGLIHLLSARDTARQPLAAAARALTVRLKAPEGGFLVETASPETQWVESGSKLIHDEHAAWHWAVIPQAKGRHRLLLQVSVRTVSQDGLALDAAAPDRLIEVRVRPNHFHAARRWAWWLTTLLLGAAIGYFGPRLVEAGVALAKKILGA